MENNVKAIIASTIIIMITILVIGTVIINTMSKTVELLSQPCAQFK